jgi:predicted dehydrogenase
VYESLPALLDADSLDGVLIAAPTDQHPALAADAGGLLQVGCWRRFVPELRRLREQIAASELGQISLLSCMQRDSELPPDEFRSHSAGLTVDVGVHEFDQVRWLLGESSTRSSPCRRGRARGNVPRATRIQPSCSPPPVG